MDELPVESESKRPRRWSSQTTWIPIFVGVFSTIAALIVVVPGLPVIGRPQMLAGKVRQAPQSSGNSRIMDTADFAILWDHGWPLTFLQREQGFSEGLPPTAWRTARSLATSRSWLVPRYRRYLTPLVSPGITWRGEPIAWSGMPAWELASADAAEFSWTCFMFDVAISIAFVAAMTWGARRWILSRRAVWRWRILDFLVVTAILAAGLSWRQYAIAGAGRGVDTRIHISDSSGKWRLSLTHFFVKPMLQRASIPNIKLSQKRYPHFFARLFGSDVLGDPFRSHIESRTIGALPAFQRSKLSLAMDRSDDMTAFDATGKLSDFSGLREIPCQSLVLRTVNPNPDVVEFGRQFDQAVEVRIVAPGEFSSTTTGP